MSRRQPQQPSETRRGRRTSALLRVVLSAAFVWLAACDFARTPPPQETDGIGTSPSIDGLVPPQMPGTVMPPSGWLTAPMSAPSACGAALPLLYGAPAPRLEQGTLAGCVTAATPDAR